jgi:hypothetical protein
MSDGSIIVIELMRLVSLVVLENNRILGLILLDRDNKINVVGSFLRIFRTLPAASLDSNERTE